MSGSAATTTTNNKKKTKKTNTTKSKKENNIPIDDSDIRKKKKNDDYVVVPNTDEKATTKQQDSDSIEIPYVIKNDELLTFIISIILGLGGISLHFIPTEVVFKDYIAEESLPLNTWIIATIISCMINYIYIEASMKFLLVEQKQQRLGLTAREVATGSGGTDGAENGFKLHNYRYMMTELPISFFLIAMTLVGWNYSTPILIVQSIIFHGCYNIFKLKYNKGIPFFKWYLIGCTIFDLCYATTLYVVYIYMEY